MVILIITSFMANSVLNIIFLLVPIFKSYLSQNFTIQMQSKKKGWAQNE